MNKLSKAYNRATCELDALVRKTRAVHHSAVDELEAAAAENSKWNRPIPEYDYQGRAAQATARAVYEGKKKDCFRTVTGAWDSFDSKTKEIRAELASAVAEASTLNAKDVDANAVTLLNSGLMTARDYAQMAKDYAENSTVLSLLRASATKYCDGLRDDGGQGNATEIVNTRHVIETAKTSGEMELTAFVKVRGALPDVCRAVSVKPAEYIAKLRSTPGAFFPPGLLERMKARAARMNEELSPRERAALKTHERAEAKKAAWRAACEDRRKAVEILRQIRDDEMSTNSERIKAIELLSKYTN